MPYISTVRRILFSAALLASNLAASAENSLEQTFLPWVYWYFQDGHLTREGMKADLESMKKAGIGGALYLETTAWGIPKEPVKFMSEPWQVTIPPGVLRPTGNKLEIRVVNLWPNRLIGDSRLPKEQRVAQLTEGNQFYKPDAPLLTSGLLGPVRILSEP